jgi:ABC-type polysaccharide/polyol phosphate export permease
LGVYINDLSNVWKVVLRVLFFFTPLFHLVSKGSFLYTANLFNPLFYFIEIGRSLMVYNEIPELWMVYVMVGVSIFFFVFGILIFERFKFKFAEMI